MAFMFKRNYGPKPLRDIVLEVVVFLQGRYLDNEYECKAEYLWPLAERLRSAPEHDEDFLKWLFKV